MDLWRVLIAENVGLNEGWVMVKEVPEFLENAAEIFERCGEGIEADLERLPFGGLGVW